MLSKPRLPIRQPGHPLLEDLELAILAYEGAGATARDVSGRGNDGTLQGNVGWAIGRGGQVLTYTGANGDYVSVSGLPDHDAFTFTIRVRFDDVTTLGSPLYLWGTPLSERYLLSYIGTPNPGDLSFWAFQTGPITTTGFQAGVLYDISLMASLNSPFRRVYVDGTLVLDNSGTLTDANPPATSYIGGRGDNNDRSITGNIHSTIYHSRALPASQIRALHADPYAAFRPVRRWWPAVLDVAPPLVPQVYEADVRCNPSPVASVRTNPSPTADLKSNPSPTVEVKSG